MHQDEALSRHTGGEPKNAPGPDVTKIDNLHIHLSQMEKMAALGQLSSSVAHEMRNLLGMIRTAIFNIERALPHADRPVKNNIEVITRSVSRAREFIDNLLNLSRISGKSEETIDLCTVVDNLLMLFCKELEWRGIELIREYHRLPPFRLDSSALQECLLNLMLNAIQCMENGGQIKVTLAPYAEGGIIAVEDTGCGIPEEDLGKIFDRFYTTKKYGQGTGLGLSIARSIARDLGGDLTVKSQVGVGSTFTIRLPQLKVALNTLGEGETSCVSEAVERG